MIQKKAIFNNLFTNHTITPDRLYNFGGSVVIKLQNANSNGQYTNIIAELEAVLKALFIEKNNVKTNLTAQVNKTRRVNELMTAFVDFMKDVEPVIARALGGRKSNGYREFYLHTILEYDTVNKSNIFIFTNRVYKIAEKYKSDLGEKLTSELQAFDKDYDTARNLQQGEMASLSYNRTKRNKYFLEAQWVLTAAVHYAAFINRSNEAVSCSLFPFDMLYPKTRHKIKRLKGALDVLQTGELPHYSLITTSCITIKNVCANAHLLVWIANKEDGISVPASPIVVKALSSKKLTGEMLKDIAGKKVLIKNSSEVNKAYYEIAITGLKKQQAIEMNVEDKEEADETMPVMVAAS